MDECRNKAKDLWIDGKPKKWYYAIPIILIWIIILIAVIGRILVCPAKVELVEAWNILKNKLL